MIASVQLNSGRSGEGLDRLSFFGSRALKVSSCAFGFVSCVAPSSRPKMCLQETDLL